MPTSDPHSKLLCKFREMLKLLTINLNHFPTHEKFALTTQIRECAYLIHGYIIEGEKRYQKKTTLTNLDIRKFYYSINHTTLKQIFRKKIKDDKLLAVMGLFISDNVAEIGLPIGNLLSQLYALIYLNELDQFIKRELKIEHYIRYVDDFILVGLTKEQCYDNKSSIENFIATVLQLKLSHWTIAKIKRGCNFVGYRTWKSLKFIRKRSIYNFHKQLKRKNYEAVVSLLGHAKNTSSLSEMLEKYHATLQIPTPPHR